VAPTATTSDTDDTLRTSIVTHIHNTFYVIDTRRKMFSAYTMAAYNLIKVKVVH